MQEWAVDLREPPLEEVFGDPIVKALMQRDGVDRRWLERLMARIDGPEAKEGAMATAAARGQSRFTRS